MERRGFGACRRRTRTSPRSWRGSSERRRATTVTCASDRRLRGRERWTISIFPLEYLPINSMAPNYKKDLNNIRQAVAKRVRALRTERRFTQSELAARMGLSQGRLSQIERGDGSFTAEQFLLLLRLFNVPVSHFA